MQNLVERHVGGRILEALDDTRIVVVQGARQVGKTTLVRDVVGRRGGRLVTLDDAVVRRAALADPVAFLEQASGALLAVDEVQRVPELVLALKLIVDRDPRPGRFLLTGSADLLRLPTAEDSLAGRAESIELHGFSQGELTGHREAFVDRLMGGDTFTEHTSTLGRADYLDRAVAGSYPEALTRRPGGRRDLWLDGYVERIVERDAPEVSRIQQLDRLPVVLALLAARNAQELNVAGLAGETAIPATSLGAHVALLETLYLIQRIPAWSTNLTKRVVSRPKVALLDSGLAARLVNVSAAGAAAGADGTIAGSLLEGFVAGELRRQLGWAREPVRLSHYRDRAGAEVDLVLTTPDGRVAGIEVKAAATVGPRDTKWLSQLRDRLGDRFVAGLVLHTGRAGAPFGDRIAAVPMDVLWTA